MASRIPFLDTLPLSAFNNSFFLSVVLTCSLLFSVRCRLHLFVLETPMLHLVTSLLIYSYSDSSHRGQYAAYFCSSIRHTEHLWSHFDKTCCNYVPRRCKCHTGFFGDRPRWVLLYLKGGSMFTVTSYILKNKKNILISKLDCFLVCFLCYISLSVNVSRLKGLCVIISSSLHVLIIL